MYRNIEGWSPLSAVAQDTDSTSACIQKTKQFEPEIAELLFKASKLKISEVILSYHNLGGIKKPLSANTLAEGITFSISCCKQLGSSESLQTKIQVNYCLYS